MKSITQLLQHNKSLTELILNSNRIRSNGAKLLASVLETKNKTLKKLEVANGLIASASGINAISNMLPMNKSLQTLNLGGNTIGNEGLITLVTALRSNRTLKTLDIQYNRIGNDGVLFFANELKYNIALKKLVIHDNEFDDMGALSLYKAMEWNTTLDTLILYPNIGSRITTNPPKYDQDMQSTILMIRFYNNSLRIIEDIKLPYGFDTTIIATYVPRHKKGQRQKNDILYWLSNHHEQWPSSCQINTIN
jgi:hypothetical protein